MKKTMIIYIGRNLYEVCFFGIWHICIHRPLRVHRGADFYVSPLFFTVGKIPCLLGGIHPVVLRFCVYQFYAGAAFALLRARRLVLDGGFYIPPCVAASV
jgi:hypothetical protein